MGQLVQEQIAGFSGGRGGTDVAAERAEYGEPGSEVGGKLGVDFAAETLRESGAFTCGRDGDLQIAAGDDGSKVEVAVGRVVDGVAKDVASQSFFVDGVVYAGCVGGGDDEEGAVKV
jgi:hypothetical protein